MSISRCGVGRPEAGLTQAVYADREDTQTALRLGRPFNVIYMPMVWKFDFFPAHAFPLGAEELDRAVHLSNPEDILLAKLHCFHIGGGLPEVHLRDIEGILRTCKTSLDREYLARSAAKWKVLSLLNKALSVP